MRNKQATVILTYLKKHKTITAYAISKETGFSVSSVKRNLREMAASDIARVVSSGEGKTVYAIGSRRTVGDAPKKHGTTIAQQKRDFASIMNSARQHGHFGVLMAQLGV